MRALPLLAAAVLLVASARAPWVPPEDARVLLTAGYLAALGALWLNRTVPWCAVVLAGTALNAAAIVAGGGRMPVSPAALAPAGAALLRAVAAGADPRHVLAGPHTLAALLGDRVPLGAGRFAVVASPGDLLMALGIAGLVQAAMSAEDSGG